MRWLVRGSAFHAFWPWNEDYWIFQSNNFAASYIQHLICHHYVMSWRSDSYNNKLWELLETWLSFSYTLLKWVHGAFFSNVNHDSAQGTVESTFHRHNLGQTLLLAANWFVGDVPLSTRRRSHEGHVGTHFCRTKLTLQAIICWVIDPWFITTIQKSLVFYFINYVSYCCLLLLGDNEPATPQAYRPLI